MGAYVALATPREQRHVVVTGFQAWPRSRQTLSEKDKDERIRKSRSHKGVVFSP